jgi:hypothetical protein|tara:strand:- start:1573 stop:3051 length:1479 start_codon:yes stop_codon:yes gene_type:complete
MAALTRIKHLTSSGTTAPSSLLKTGEIAYTYGSGTQANGGGRVYIGVGAESGGIASGQEVVGGKYFTDLLDHAHGTTTANSALIVDSAKHVDILNIGSLALEASGGSGQVVTAISTDTSMGGGSASNANLATQLAIKTYVDAQITAQDLDFQGDTGGALSIDLDSEVFTIAGTANEIETAGSGNTITIGLPTNVDIAGDLDVATLDVATSAEIASAKIEDLTNNRVVIAGTGGELEDDGNFTFDGSSLNIGAGNFTVAQATGNTVVGGTLQVNGNVTLGDSSSDTVQTQGNLTVGGNLTVQGTTTSVNSTQTTLTDPMIELAKDTSSADGLDRGVRFKYHNGSAVKDGFFGLDIQTERFIFTKDEDFSGGENASTPFHDAQFGGVFAGNVQLGITGDNEIDTTSGGLTLDSAGGTVTVDDNLSVTGTVSLTNDLEVAHGGTGVSSFTDNGVLFGDGSNALDVTAASSANGSILQADSGGAPAFSNIIDGGTF